MRWLGAVKPEHGLDKPVLRVSFKTTGNSGGALAVGTPTANGLHAATADGVTGCFAISHPDFTAFELPVIDKPAATPAPATPAAATPVGETPAVPAPPTAPQSPAPN